MGALNLVITGAAGFVGRHAVGEARARGHRVRAVIRGKAPADWARDAGIAVAQVDLASDGAERALLPVLRGADAVIHAAAALSGDDVAQARDTATATRTLLRAMQHSRVPRLVLVSSLAVYDFAALPEGATLDEAAPLERDGRRRDAYCRAKLAQEALARQAAEAQGFRLRLLRPGAVFGPGRLWNAHVGPALGPVVLRTGGAGLIPLSWAPHCAEATVLAAETPQAAQVEAVNVVDDDLPDRERFLAALQASGWPRLVVPLDWRILLAAARLAAPLEGRLPGLLRVPVLRARMMPLDYANAALHRLGWRPRKSFEEAMAAAIAGTP